jgi:hypothetical protein
MNNYTERVLYYLYKHNINYDDIDISDELNKVMDINKESLCIHKEHNNLMGIGNYKPIYSEHYKLICVSHCIKLYRTVIINEILNE